MPLEREGRQSLNAPVDRAGRQSLNGFVVSSGSLEASTRHGPGLLGPFSRPASMP